MKQRRQIFRKKSLKQMETFKGMVVGEETDDLRLCLMLQNINFRILFYEFTDGNIFFPIIMFFQKINYGKLWLVFFEDKDFDILRACQKLIRRKRSIYMQNLSFRNSASCHDSQGCHERIIKRNGYKLVNSYLREKVFQIIIKENAARSNRLLKHTYLLPCCQVSN